MSTPRACTRPSFFAAWAVAALIPVDAAAQTVAHSFADLQLAVKTNETVYVFDTSGRDTRGRIDLVSPAALHLAVDGARRDFLEAQVSRIERHRRDSIRNGLLMGLGGGAAIGFLAGRRVDEGPCPPKTGCGEAELIGAIGGAFWGSVAGWIADALHHTREVIYRAPGRP